MAKLFDFRDFVDLQISDPVRREQVLETLKLLSQTPEFQETLQSFFAEKGQKMKVILGEKTGFDKLSDDLVLNMEDIARTRYLGEDGTLRDVSLTRVLVHEIFHAVDPTPRQQDILATKKVIGEAFILVAKQDLGIDTQDAELAGDAVEQAMKDGRLNTDKVLEFINEYKDNRKPHEIRAIEYTNAFMAKYFNEPPRDAQRYSRFDVEGSPELETHRQITHHLETLLPTVDAPLTPKQLKDIAPGLEGCDIAEGAACQVPNRSQERIPTR